MAENLSALGEHIATKLGSAVTGNAVAFGELTIHAEAAEINTVLTFLRDDPECHLSASLIFAARIIRPAKAL